MDESSENNSPTRDRVLRGITSDDNFRVICATTSELVRGAIATQGIDGETAQHFGNLMTGTVLIRQTMSPDYRVQSVMKGAGGRGTLVADSHPSGMTRGIVELPSDVDTFKIGQGSALQLMRSMAQGKMFRSVVEPPPDGTVAQGLMTYLQESEQIVSVIRTGVAWRNGELLHAGGFVVQLLPDAARGALMIMTERLEALAPADKFLVDVGGCAKRMLDELLYGIEYAQLDDQSVYHGCNCSRETVVGALATVSPDEIKEMLKEDEIIELSCDYCKTNYQLGHAQLSGMLESS
ncbi:MAG: Hsp33 family molecular chaperone HslO [Polyangiaceae bacterium]